VTSREATELQRGARDLGVAIDAEIAHRIDKFIDLLEIWNRRIRLTGDRDRLVLIRKHVLDSLAVVPELPRVGLVIDLGSGGGFPGIVLGCARPDLALRLIEPRRRPTSFLSEAIREIPLPRAQALAVRGEEAAKDPALSRQGTVVVGRALRIDTLIRTGLPLLAPEGTLVAMQTPVTSEASVSALLREASLTLVRSRDYELPDGAPRRLLILARSH
jgi:16S rRNA (guanine527-N7)-methyltransferase